MIKATAGYSWPLYILKILVIKADLSYISFLFLLFLIGFLCIYFLLRTSGARRSWLLLANIVFYLYDSVGGFFFVAASGLTCYVVARMIGRIYEGFDGTGLSAKEKRKAFVPYEKKARIRIAVGFVVIIGLWIFVKVGKLLGLATVGLSEFLGGGGIIVPLGISYYTLCMIAYVMDVYWQKTQPEKNFLKLFTAMTYFPYITQGPFVRYQNIVPQFEHLPGADYNRICRGAQLMIWGYFKKLVVADRLSQFTGRIFGDPASYGGPEILLAILLAAVELYADFSGCMDIITGISTILGIEIPQNFRQPFFSKSAAEFWRRWHISLGDWTKEYIYLPIAMNAKFLKKGRQIKKNHGALAAKTFTSFFPLFAVWLFTGLWHGTGLDYICWGMYWGVIIILAQVTEDIWPSVTAKLHINTGGKIWTFWRMLRTFLIFCIGRMWTLVGGLSGCALLWKRLFAFNGSILQIFKHGMNRYQFIVVGIGIVLMWAVDLAHEHNIKIRETIAARPLVLRWIVYAAAITAVVVFGVYGPGFNAASFVYGNF